MSQDRVLATYLTETPHSLEHAAAVMAGEQSSGTFVSVPGETNELKERYGATVLRTEPLDTVPAPSLPGTGRGMGDLRAGEGDSGVTVRFRASDGKIYRIAAEKFGQAQALDPGAQLLPAQ